MIRILSYSMQLSEHLKVREALKEAGELLSELKDEIKVDSIFSVEIMDDLVKKAAREGHPIHLILYNEKISHNTLPFLPLGIPVICLKGFEQDVANLNSDREMVFFQVLEDIHGFTQLVSKCLQMQILRYDLKQSQSVPHDNRLTLANFIEILGDHLNRAFIFKHNLALVLFKFITYGKDPVIKKNKTSFLRELHDHLTEILDPDWNIYSFGMTDIGILIDNVSDGQEFNFALRRLHQEANNFFVRHETVVSIDLGVALSQDKIVDPIELYDQAMTALAIANRKGHGFVEYYGHEQEHKLLFSTRVESELKQALQDRKLDVVYQPLICFKEHKTIGVEALVRWNHPTLGHISPVEFLPIADRIHGMNDLADIVFHRAFEDLNQWKKDGLNLSMAVNIGGQQLVSGNLINHLVETTKLYGLEPSDIEIEVTEDFDLNHIDPIVYQLEELKDLGFRIAIDDFGVGYSSLHYLSQFPVDKIKIDRSFIQGLNEKKVKILEAMLNLANFMRVETLVEGIETKEQLEMLKFIGFGYGQGYLFSPPLPADKLKDFLVLDQISNLIP